MAFEDVKIIDPYVEKGWTPELKLTLATPKEVNVLEAKIKVSFPEGYKEYVTILGFGVYYGKAANFRVDMPSAILADYKNHQEFLDEYWFWEDGEELLSKTKAIESIKIADTDGGDVIIFHPSNSKELFLLPHEDEIIYKIGTNLYEGLEFDWNCNPEDFDFRKQKYFIPDNPFAYTHGVIYPEEVS